MSSPSSVADSLAPSTSFTVIQNGTNLSSNQAPAGTATHDASFKAQSQCEGQDAVVFNAQPPGEEMEGVSGLFPDSSSGGFGIKNHDVLESENLLHSVLNLLNNTTLAVASHFNSTQDVTRLGGGDSIPGIDVDSCRVVTGSIETGDELVLLKERRDAALFDYEQCVKAVHRHAAHVAWLDMCYIKALRSAYLGQD